MEIRMVGIGIYFVLSPSTWDSTAIFEAFPHLKILQIRVCLKMTDSPMIMKVHLASSDGEAEVLNHKLWK
jgi:hypothetical protein